MIADPVWEKDGYILRLAQMADLDGYYCGNYCPLDTEVARLTGSKDAFSKEEIALFFEKYVVGGEGFLFLIIAPDGSIIGETVLNEIDTLLRSANFRIAIYRAAARGKGIGTWAIEMTRDFAFRELRLHRLSLDVYSFNPVAKRAYLKAGFREEGVLRDAIADGPHYADDILMSMLEEEWRALIKNA